MRAIVTGGLGFIGSFLSEMLIERGHEVTILDNKSSNAVEDGEILCETIIDEARRLQYWSDIRNLRPDAVVHCASYVGPVGILKHAGWIVRDIVADTAMIMDYCIEKKALLIDVSTSEIYGHAGILSEDSPKTIPGKYTVRNEYAAAKLASEIMITNRALVEPRLKYHIIRPFNVAGPRQKPDGGFVIPRFVIAALTGQPLTIYGDGSQMRAYGHVRDICRAIIAVMDSTNSMIKNQAWNVGNEYNLMSIGEMALIVKSRINKRHPGKEMRFIYGDPKNIHGPLFDEAIEKVPHTRKIRSLSWYPEHDMSTIIDETIEYYERKIAEGYYFDLFARWDQ